MLIEQGRLELFGHRSTFLFDEEQCLQTAQRTLDVPSVLVPMSREVILQSCSAKETGRMEAYLVNFVDNKQF